MGRRLGFLLVLTALVAGGCGGDDSSDGSGAGEESAAVGDAQTVEVADTGFDNAPTTLEVTLLAVDEDAKPDPETAQLTEPGPGNKLVALEFEATNTGETDQFGELPSATAIDSEGNEYESAIGISPFSPSFLELGVDAGESETGFEAVGLPEDAVIETVELTIDTTDSQAETLSWSVGD